MRAQIILDEDLPKRLRRELEARGFIDVTSVYQLQLKGAKDAPLAALEEFDHPVVLVTNDNKLADERGAAISTSDTISVAVVDSASKPEDLSMDAYRRDVVHRHADRFVEQEPGTVFRYRATRRRMRIRLD